MGATGPVYRTDGAERLNGYVTDGLGSAVAEVDGQGHLARPDSCERNSIGAHVQASYATKFR